MHSLQTNVQHTFAKHFSIEEVDLNEVALELRDRFETNLFNDVLSFLIVTQLYIYTDFNDFEYVLKADTHFDNFIFWISTETINCVWHSVGKIDIRELV